MTAQFHERLILEGEETSMAFCPPIPEDHPKIQFLNREEIERKMAEGKVDGRVFSTACWRAYIGTWELKDGRFYLKAVEGRYYYDGDDLIFADWFTGVLRIPSGRRVRYVHMGFKTVYEFETHIKIENGLVMSERRIDNTKKNFRGSSLGWETPPENKDLLDDGLE